MNGNAFWSGRSCSCYLFHAGTWAIAPATPNLGWYIINTLRYIYVMLIHPVSNAYISNFAAPNCAVWVLNTLKFILNAEVEFK